MLGTREQLFQYILRLYNNVPAIIYECLLFVLILGTVGLIFHFGWRNGIRKVGGLLLMEYVLLIYCSTVICRESPDEIVGHNYNPFWSYEEIQNGNKELMAENFMNIIVFLPVGSLLGIISKNTPRLLKGAFASICIGLTMSLSIEALQYFYNCGFAEFDDVFHNTLGCLFGYLIIAFVKIFRRLRSYAFCTQL